MSTKKITESLTVVQADQHAKLPASYEAARAKLAECVKLDECREWTNKAEAMASYAKQAKDPLLLKHAKRIKARAIERCGELIAATPAAKGGRPWKQHTSSSGQVNRSRVAEDAGLSKRQKDTALAVAAVPKAVLDAAIESDDPPTVKALAKLGTKPGKPKPEKDPVLEAFKATKKLTDAQCRELLELIQDDRGVTLFEGLGPEVPAPPEPAPTDDDGVIIGADDGLTEDERSARNGHRVEHTNGSAQVETRAATRWIDPD